MDIKKVQAFLYEIKSFKQKLEISHNGSEYIYADTYQEWIKEYNDLLRKYNTLYGLDVSLMTYTSADLSSSKKTARNVAVDVFIAKISELIKNIEADIEQIRKEQYETKIMPHQMRKCFKMGLDHCSLNPEYKRNKAFIAMPFAPEYADSYEYGIKPALSASGYEHFRADGELNNKDIMCKICFQLQLCGLAIINISSLNPNVMLELGMAYGLGKPVIILKDSSTAQISDLGCIEYIEYPNAYELHQKLYKALNQKNFL